MGCIKLDAYAGLTLHVPRVDDVLAYIETMPFDVIHLSTPGPMGLLGLLAARHRGLPVCGTYHTDFPGYARVLSGDPDMEEVGWKFMRWFYGQLDRVAAPTESIRRTLIDHGMNPARLDVVGRGVKTDDFTPALRDPAWREQWGGDHPLKLLYVGRVSKEKNLETLTAAFRRLVPTRPDLCLVVVGDGPYREEMEASLAGLPAYFTGTLNGEDLARAYASCDLFVFPSKTDTFGRVVLEAQASGLPVIVSDEGGPRDAMVDQQTGVVVSGLNDERLAHAIDRLTDEPARHLRYRHAARRHASTLTPEASFQAFWKMHESLRASSSSHPQPR
jgi:glycosyltransferase involved in cell wall biosynthesis